MAVRSGAEVKVGIFVVVALIALAYLTMQVGRGTFGLRGLKEYIVLFDTVSGLRSGAPVEIAGIEVGSVQEIQLIQGRAEVVLGVREEVQIFADAMAIIRTRGILGDKFVEILPGSPGEARLEAGGRIARTQVPADLDQVFQKVGDIAEDISTVTKRISGALGEDGEQNLKLIVENVRELTEGLNAMVNRNMEGIGEIVANMRAFSADMRELSRENKEGVTRIVQNLEQASEDMKNTLVEMEQVLTGIQQGEGALGRLITDREMGEDLRTTMASLRNVSEKIDEGKGTIGMLINDETMAEDLDQTLQRLNALLTRQEQFRTTVDVSTEYLTRSGDLKSYLNLRLQPSEDKYYLLSVVDDPKGRTEVTETTTRTRVDDGLWTVTRSIEEETERDGLKFSAQIAKRWRNLALRGGIIESSGGVGLDYYLMDDRLQVLLEAFDFDQDDPPHLKAGVKLYFLHNFYLTAGLDDFVSDSGNESFYTGLGFYFTDEDLKYLLTSVPLPAGR
jgi:phospholipid/cholesterol/gamma-HCH transport system substrate-binding protein